MASGFPCEKARSSIGTDRGSGLTRPLVYPSLTCHPPPFHVVHGNGGSEVAYIPWPLGPNLQFILQGREWPFPGLDYGSTNLICLKKKASINHVLFMRKRLRTQMPEFGWNSWFLLKAGPFLDTWNFIKFSVSLTLLRTAKKCEIKKIISCTGIRNTEFNTISLDTPVSLSLPLTSTVLTVVCPIITHLPLISPHSVN